MEKELKAQVKRESSEKRWYNRYKVTASGALANGTYMCKVELLDLSAGGARVRGDLYRVKEGDEIYLSIAFNPPIKVKGEVRWCKKTDKGMEVGIKFTQMDFKTRQHLQTLISQIALAGLDDSYTR